MTRVSPSMSLTPVELAAARAFRDMRRQLLARGDADVTVSVFTANDRHDCAKRGGKSVFLQLREHYAFSPEIVVHSDEGGVGGIAVVDDGAGASWAPPEGFEQTVLPPRRFGWIWTEGKCPACGLTARSSSGRLVDPGTRPPGEHAVVC